MAKKNFITFLCFLCLDSRLKASETSMWKKKQWYLATTYSIHEQGRTRWILILHLSSFHPLSPSGSSRRSAVLCGIITLSTHAAKPWHATRQSVTYTFILPPVSQTPTIVFLMQWILKATITYANDWVHWYMQVYGFLRTVHIFWSYLVAAHVLSLLFIIDVRLIFLHTKRFFPGFHKFKIYLGFI